MKPIYFKKYQQGSDSSILVKYAEVPHTYDRFHYHNEYEMMLHIQNRGTRFVGDSIERFDNGDLILVGPNTPHYWHSDDIFYKGNDDLMAKVILVQFSKDFLSSDFLKLPEMAQVTQLLEKASRGVQVVGKDRSQIIQLIMELPQKQGWEQLLSFIKVLCLISESEGIKLLASPGFNSVSWLKRENKMSHIFEYLMANYQRAINLEEAASFSNMNKTAFCRYFKKAVNKTFSQTLNEIRIGFACKEMIYSDKTIAEIAFDCGYDNVSYFNRMFKEIKEMTPSEFRNFHA